MDIHTRVSFFISVLVVIVLLITILFQIIRYKKVQENLRYEKASFIFRLIQPIMRLVINYNYQTNENMVNRKLTAKLSSAGLLYALPAEEFLVAQFAFSFTGLILAYSLVSTFNTGMAPSIFLFLLLPLVMFIYPVIWLNEKIKNRHVKFVKELSLFIDLLTLSIRAGLNIHSALNHAATNMPQGPLKDEFNHVLREIRTGVSRREALSNLANRVQLSAVSSFVAAINQSEETGGEIGPVLMSQAEQRRKERFMRAEKLANQAPVKLLAPLIGLLFPITFILIFFPIFIKARDSGALSFFFK